MQQPGQLEEINTSICTDDYITWSLECFANEKCFKVLSFASFAPFVPLKGFTSLVAPMLIVVRCTTQQTSAGKAGVETQEAIDVPHPIVFATVRGRRYCCSFIAAAR